MMHNKQRRLVIPAAMAIVLVVACAARATLPSHPAPGRTQLVGAPTYVGALVAVPTDQRRLFAALRAPATESVPAIVREQTIAGPEAAVRAFGPDVTQARSAEVDGKQLFLIPGQNGLCLFLADGTSLCTADLATVAKDGITLAVVPPAPGPVKDLDNPIGDGTITTLGFMPDGVNEVVATTEDGHTARAAVTNNAFLLKTTSPVARTTLKTVGGA